MRVSLELIVLDETDPITAVSATGSSGPARRVGISPRVLVDAAGKAPSQIRQPERGGVIGAEGGPDRQKQLAMLLTLHDAADAG